jgi:hypothetical protein
VAGLCLEVHDLAISKLAAGRDRRPVREDVVARAHHRC